MLANKEKVVAFAGHRYNWHCIGIEDKLPQVLEELIQKGYTIFYDGSILPEIEELHYKQKIVKRNEWIIDNIDNCDILVCHIEETYKRGAYHTLKYAQTQNKPIIYI